MIDWILDKIPLWVWIVAAVFALVAIQRTVGWRGVVAGLVAFGGLFAYRQGRKTGREDAEAKTAREKAKAQQERIQMRNEGDAARQKAKGMTDEEARKEALKWSKR